jgi:hypothetical protein
VTVLLLSAARTVCCLAGAVGVWVFRQAASEKVDRVSARLDVGLERAPVVNRNVRRALAKAGAAVGRAGGGSADLGGGNAKGRLAAGAHRRSLRRDVPHETNDLGGRLGSRAAYFKRAIHERLIEHKEYIARHGDDMPALSGWKWGQSGGPAAGKRDTAADNV